MDYFRYVTETRQL